MARVYAVGSSTRYAEYVELEQTEKAYWIGRGAEQIGLVGYVEPKQFRLLEQGIDPISGEVLRPRQGHALTKNGNAYAHGRSVYDLVVMAPKSVSIVGLVDDRVVEAHKRAVRAIERDIESHAQVRVRQGAANETDQTRPTRNIVAGVWRHELSRNLDPLIHSHIGIVNMSFDQVEGRWKALQAVELYRHRWELSEAYREDLAPRLEDCGYGLRPRELSEFRYPKDYVKEREWGFEIDGISPDLLDKFSTRTQERDHAISEYERVHPEKQLTEHLVDKLVRENRHPKQFYTEFEQQQIREVQLARLAPAERADLLRIRDQAMENPERIQEKQRAPSPGDPWMAQTGGAENLSAHHLASARKSYSEWEYKDRYSFANYVAYVQKKWAENPEMLKEWPRNGSESTSHRFRPHDHVGHEPELHHREWNYGEDTGMKVRVG